MVFLKGVAESYNFVKCILFLLMNTEKKKEKCNYFKQKENFQITVSSQRYAIYLRNDWIQPLMFPYRVLVTILFQGLSKIGEIVLMCAFVIFSFMRFFNL